MKYHRPDNVMLNVGDLVMFYWNGYTEEDEAPDDVEFHNYARLAVVTKVNNSCSRIKVDGAMFRRCSHDRWSRPVDEHAILHRQSTFGGRTTVFPAHYPSTVHIIKKATPELVKRYIESIKEGELVSEKYDYYVTEPISKSNFDLSSIESDT